MRSPRLAGMCTTAGASTPRICTVRPLPRLSPAPPWGWLMLWIPGNGVGGSVPPRCSPPWMRPRWPTWCCSRPVSRPITSQALVARRPQGWFLTLPCRTGKASSITFGGANLLLITAGAATTTGIFDARSSAKSAVAGRSERHQVAPLVTRRDRRGDSVPPSMAKPCPAPTRAGIEAGDSGRPAEDRVPAAGLARAGPVRRCGTTPLSRGFASARDTVR
jgi:hypothetical protein